MLGTALFIQGIISKGTELFIPTYENMLIQEENEESGVFRAAKLIKNHNEILDLHKWKANNLSVILLEFDITKDPIGIILQKPILYVTPNEMEFLDTVNMWDEDDVLSVLKHIETSQPIRSHIYNGGTI